MAQNTDVALPETRHTRADFAALRAHLQRVPVERIADLYYAEDDLMALGCHDGDSLRRRLEDLRDRLVAEAETANPHLSELLRTARRSGTWSPRLVDHLVRAGETDRTAPRRQDHVTAWLRPRLSAVLREESIGTLGDLMDWISERGRGWWKPLRLIGEGKARRLEAWLRSHGDSLGQLDLSAAGPLDNLPSPALVEVGPGSTALAPLGLARLPPGLSGAEGLNRAESHCQISARNDMAAAEAYLYKHRANARTLASYSKELGRWLLFCVVERGKAMSDATMEDCEAYKDFLDSPPEGWVGPRAPHGSSAWRPFAGTPSPSSRRYAVQALRSFHEWLVAVRYLAGNPWITVSDPPVAKPLAPLQIEKALPSALWEKLSMDGGALDQLGATDADELRRRYRMRGSAARHDMPAQFRLAKAALLLMGDGGLRREEASTARRDRLRPVPGSDLWELDVLGKRNKWRTVFLPPRAVSALAAHWADRGLDFGFGMDPSPLLSPLSTPPTDASRRKHGEDGKGNAGYSADGLYRAVTTTLRRLAGEPVLDLDATERSALASCHPHSLRHTFGTAAAAKEVPLDVLQRVMGHASLQTTTIYVQAEKRRSVEEMGKFFSS